MFITALIAIIIAEVGFIIAMVGPYLFYRSPTQSGPLNNVYALMAYSFVNISSYSQRPMLINPVVFNGTEPVVVFVTLAPATGCTIPTTLVNLTKVAKVVLVLLNQPSVGYGYITPVQWPTVLGYMQTISCLPPPNVTLATAPWFSPPNELPVGLFNMTQLMGIINSTTVEEDLAVGNVTFIPMVMVARGNGTLVGYLLGLNALNLTRVLTLITEASPQP